MLHVSVKVITWEHSFHLFQWHHTTTDLKGNEKVDKGKSIGAPDGLEFDF